MTDQSPVGKTKTQGWEIGVRRTFTISPEHAWVILMSDAGLRAWLGTGLNAQFAKGNSFTTAEGIHGEIRSYSEGSLIRMRYQPKDWSFPSTLQVRVTPTKTGTAISFHHELLQSAEQREQMRQHWESVIAHLGRVIEAG